MANDEHLAILKRGVEEWNRWREENPGKYPDLRGAVLIDANLRFAFLKHVDLSGADLRNADLRETDLRGATGIGADLRGANLRSSFLRDTDLTTSVLRSAIMRDVILRKTRLRRADLRDAILRDADLSRADLSRADLRGADLSHAKLQATNLRDANLRQVNLIDAILQSAEVIGADLTLASFGNNFLADIDLGHNESLAATVHLFPSTLGTDTLTKSKGRIPKAFLRGCGLTDWEIQVVKLWDPDLSHDERTDLAYELVNLQTKFTAVSFYSCFISYNHTDKSFAHRLHDQLQARGIRCWLDEHQLLPGDDIYEEVDRGIRLWDKVLLCCSEASLTSWWVDNEIDSTFKKEQRLMKERAWTHRLEIDPPNA